MSRSKTYQVLKVSIVSIWRIFGLYNVKTYILHVSDFQQLGHILTYSMHPHLDFNNEV